MSLSNESLKVTVVEELIKHECVLRDIYRLSRHLQIPNATSWEVQTMIRNRESPFQTLAYVFDNWVTVDRDNANLSNLVETLKTIGWHGVAGIRKISS